MGLSIAARFQMFRFDEWVIIPFCRQEPKFETKNVCWLDNLVDHSLTALGNNRLERLIATLKSQAKWNGYFYVIKCKQNHQDLTRSIN